MPNTTSPTTLLPFSVDLWGSDPEEGNDDCWMGTEFATLKEAQAAYQDPAAISSVFARNLADSRYIVLSENVVRADGVREMTILAKRVDPSFKRCRADRDWDQEIATQAGMVGGVEAYNDALGYF